MIQLRVPGVLAYRHLALRVASYACKMMALEVRGLPPDTNEPEIGADADDFEAEVVSAFGEAFNNVALHAYGEGQHGDAIIEIRWTSDVLTMELTDVGRSFDPDAVAPPELESLPEGGMGLFIMRSFVDDLAYEPGPPNRLRMTKRQKRAVRADEDAESRESADPEPSDASSSEYGDERASDWKLKVVDGARLDNDWETRHAAGDASRRP